MKLFEPCTEFYIHYVEVVVELALPLHNR